MAPQIDRTNLKDVTVRAGQSFRFDVKVIGEPPPTTSWYRDDTKLESKDNVIVEKEPYKTKLSVNSAKRSDTGKYTIKAENPSGKDEETVDVTVIGKLRRHINIFNHRR